MNKNQEYLQKVRIATPCSADWDKMEGDDRVRHCQQCDLNVFNISQMTAKEARDLIQNSTGRVCIQMYRRVDGTVITRDCPRGLEKVRKAYRRTVASIAGFIGWLALVSPVSAQCSLDKSQIRVKSSNAETVRGKVKVPDYEQSFDSPPIMGDVVQTNLEAGMATVPYKGEASVVEDVDIKRVTPVVTPKTEKPQENHLLAAGLITMVFAALFKLIFMRLRRRSSIWLVGTAFISAFSLIGIIWHCFW